MGDWIRPDQALLTLCLRVSGSRKELQVAERLLGDFYFSNSEWNESQLSQYVL